MGNTSGPKQPHPDIFAIVHGDNLVRLQGQGEPIALSKATVITGKQFGHERDRANGSKSWSYNGELLEEIHNRIRQERDEDAIQAREDFVEQQIIKDINLDDTTRTSLVKSRIGQGTYRGNVLRIENKCRFTGVEEPKFLKASHMKPWRDCATAQERLDGFNGLALTAQYDDLFDGGYFTFEPDGTMIVSPQLSQLDFEMMSIKLMNVGSFRSEQLPYLEWHRTRVFRAS
jgi:predicted restriction endonuclease